MSGFDTEANELFAAQTLVSEAADEGGAELVRLQAAADDLLGHGWRGGAATAFAEGWQEWLTGAELVLTVLREMSRALGASAAGYANAETASTDTLRGIA